MPTLERNGKKKILDQQEEICHAFARHCTS